MDCWVIGMEGDSVDWVADVPRSTADPFETDRLRDHRRLRPERCNRRTESGHRHIAAGGVHTLVIVATHNGHARERRSDDVLFPPAESMAGREVWSVDEQPWSRCSSWMIVRRPDSSSWRAFARWRDALAGSSD